MTAVKRRSAVLVMGNVNGVIPARSPMEIWLGVGVLKLQGHVVLMPPLSSAQVTVK